MKHITLALLFIAVLVSCKKTTAVMSDASQIMAPGDSIIFSPNVRPTGRRFDSNDHKFLIDSFYTNTTLITKRITLSVTDGGSVTQNVKVFIDSTVIDKLLHESRFDQWLTRLFDFKKVYTISPGWHQLKFKGTSYPQMDTINIFYTVFPGDFECTNMNGEIVPVYGLPIQVKKWYLKPTPE